MWFDSKLSFREHAQKWGARALRMANHLRSLNGVYKGTPPAATAKAAAACVLSVATYGAEAWWPGLQKPGT
ncbi:hypothetical protein F4804DRAFT_303761, partial [Jackrogersella minutella]